MDKSDHPDPIDLGSASQGESSSVNPDNSPSVGPEESRPPAAEGQGSGEGSGTGQDGTDVQGANPSAAEPGSVPPSADADTYRISEGPSPEPSDLPPEPAPREPILGGAPLGDDDSPATDYTARLRTNQRHQALAAGMLALPNLFVRSAGTIVLLYGLADPGPHHAVQPGRSVGTRRAGDGREFRGRAVSTRPVDPGPVPALALPADMGPAGRAARAPANLRARRVRAGEDSLPRLRRSSTTVRRRRSPTAIIRRNARVVISRGLMEILEPDELEAVVAHELGHVRNWDMVLMTLAQLVPLLLYYIYDLARRMSRHSRRSGGDRKGRGRGGRCPDRGLPPLHHQRVHRALVQPHARVLRRPLRRPGDRQPQCLGAGPREDRLRPGGAGQQQGRAGGRRSPPRPRKTCKTCRHRPPPRAPSVRLRAQGRWGAEYLRSRRRGQHGRVQCAARRRLGRWRRCPDRPGAHQSRHAVGPVEPLGRLVRAALARIRWWPSGCTIWPTRRRRYASSRGSSSIVRSPSRIGTSSWSMSP